MRATARGRPLVAQEKADVTCLLEAHTRDRLPEMVLIPFIAHGAYAACPLLVGLFCS